jgi:hypothetical protein
MSDDYGINTEAIKGVFGFVSRSKNAIHKCTKFALLEIGERLHMYSAVGDPSHWKHKPHPGYQPGLFINNWQLGVDSMPSGMLSTKPDMTAKASVASLTKIPRWPAYHNYYFVNNTPYAAILESGTHSWQVPPGGMIGRVKLEFPQIVQEAIRRYRAGADDVSDTNQVSSPYSL